MSLTAMADLPLSIHSLNDNSIGNEGAMALSKVMEKIPNLLELG